MASRLMMRRDPAFQEFLEGRPLMEVFVERFYGAVMPCSRPGERARTALDSASGNYVDDDSHIHARVALPGVLLKDVSVQDPARPVDHQRQSAKRNARSATSSSCSGSWATDASSGTRFRCPKG